MSQENKKPCDCTKDWSCAQHTSMEDMFHKVGSSQVPSQDLPKKPVVVKGPSNDNY